MFELDKKFVKFKLLYEEKEYAIIITRRAAEQRSQRLLSGCILSVKNKGKEENKIMPKTKLQEVVFTILMVFVMVYAMICYNIALNMGGMSNIVFLNAFHELVIMGPIAFILDFFYMEVFQKNLHSAL